MIVRMELLAAKAGLKIDEFAESWRQHAELTLKPEKGLGRHHHNLIIDRTQKGIVFQRGQLEFDGIAQMWFDDLNQIRRAFPSHEPSLTTDRASFVSDVTTLTTVPNPVITCRTGGSVVKRMSTIRRRPEMSQERFQREWFETHAYLVRRMPGVLGYTQNLVIDRSTAQGGASADEVPIDGVVEFIFRDAAAIEAAFTSDSGLTTMAHAKEFISEISTFIVEVTEFPLGIHRSS